MKNQVEIHFIFGNKLIKRVICTNVPRLGEEIRLDEHEIYKINRVMWVYDEPEYHHERVNIGVSKVKDV